MNPRYLAYCRAHDLSPEDMLAFDRVRAPGGHMGPFIRWISRRWEEWRRAHGRRWDDGHPDDHAPFDAWLHEVVDARLAVVRLLAAFHAKGEHLIDLLCAATADLDPEQEAAFIAFCVDGDLDSLAPAPAPRARAKARRPRKVPGQPSLF